MTHVSRAKIAGLAADIWRRHHLAPGFDVERLLDELRLDLLWEELADEGGREILGQIVPELRLVMLNERHIDRLEAKRGCLRRFTLGHEIGHWTLHCAALRSGIPRFTGGHRPSCQSESASERQADSFSAALLMPEDEVLAALPGSAWCGWRPVYRLAEDFIVSRSAMKRRLEELGCMRLDRDGVPISGRLQPVDQDTLFG